MADISSCNWPIPDETTTSGHIEQCLNFMKGCWQCTPDASPCWCYMKRFWDMQGLEPDEVRVDDDLAPLIKRIKSGFQLSSNLGMCSSHDPLQRDAIPVFNGILNVFKATGRKKREHFLNGHKLHICTKRPYHLIEFDELLHSFEIPPRIWTTITTPSDEQAAEYMTDAVDSPSRMAEALHMLYDDGLRDLGVSFGPCFGAWRDVGLTEEYLRSLPPLTMAQFEPMNHGHDELDTLMPDEVETLAHMFRMIQPECTVYLKSSAFNVGSVIS